MLAIPSSRVTMETVHKVTWSRWWNNYADNYVISATVFISQVQG